MKKIVAASVLTLLLCSDFGTPAQANPITAPACRDVPSCVVTGTVVIGGVVYYLIKNTVTGVVRRVPVRRVPPSHRKIEPGRHNVGDYVYVNVARSSDCQREAERYGREVDGGTWEVENVEQVGNAGEPGTINPDGSIHEPTISYRCKLKKVR